MKKYRELAAALIAIKRAAAWNPRTRRILKAAPLIVMFLLLNTRSAHALCHFNPAPDPTADGSSDSLRHAVQMANASAEDCTIELQRGTYTLTIRNNPGQDNTAAKGDLDITDSGHTVTIRGQGAQLSIVSMAKGIDRVLHVLNRANAVHAGANTIIANATLIGDNAADSGVYFGDDVSGPITISYSLVSQTTDALITNRGGNIFDLDPMLDPARLKFNGGPTRTIALENGSPAIDAVPLDYCTDVASPSHPLTIDQRGFPRPDGREKVCDVGAYESQ